MNTLKPFRFLPILIFVAFLAFSVRLADVTIGMARLSGDALAEAQAKAANATEPHAGDMQTEEAHGGEETQAQETAADAGESADPAHEEGKPGLVFEDNSAEVPAWRDAGDSDLEMTSVRMELFDDLAKRRAELEKAQKDMKVREALLKAAEQELDRKYQELRKLRGEIEALLERQSDEEQGRITSLVKVYEGMKPKDAARIFDTLDLDILVQVLSRMSERKLSPVLAAMNPERARTVTIMLAEQKKLPSLPQVQ